MALSPTGSLITSTSTNFILQVYEENYDAQKWLRNAALLEKWLAERENLLTEDWRTVDGVDVVEDIIRQFDDFLVTLDAQTPHFDALQKLTKLEQSYAKMRSREQEISGANLRRRESIIGTTENRRDTQQIKTVEKKKILQEKRQERERRKTQEISVLKRSPSQVCGLRLVRFHELSRCRNTLPSLATLHRPPCRGHVIALLAKQGRRCCLLARQSPRVKPISATTDSPTTRTPLSFKRMTEERACRPRVTPAS